MTLILDVAVLAVDVEAKRRPADSTIIAVAVWSVFTICVFRATNVLTLSYPKTEKYGQLIHHLLKVGPVAQ